LSKSETDEHKRLKTILTESLHQSFKLSIDEYPSSGNELDIFSIDDSCITIMVEIIWTPTKSNFLHDLVIIGNSDAKVKVVIVNPKIIQSQEYNRLYKKLKISQMKSGYQLTNLFDGKKILEDPTYLDEVMNEIKRLVKNFRSSNKGSNKFSSEDIIPTDDTLDLEGKPPVLTKMDIYYINTLIQEYNELSDTDTKITYLIKFSDLAYLSNLFEAEPFIIFIINEIRAANDKHLLLQCLYILIQLLSSSNVTNNHSFVTRIYNELYDQIEKFASSIDELYTYSYFELLSILDSFGDRINKEKLCNALWSKLETLINKSNDRNYDKQISISISSLKKYKFRLNENQRKWLRIKDDKSIIKTSILKELL
jgi:hypothetical protein